MSRPSPYHLTIGEDGLSVRCELDVHYLTDEQLETVREHVETLQAENAKLRELVRDMWLHSYCSIAKTREDDDRHIEDVIDRMRELGVDA